MKGLFKLIFPLIIISAFLSCKKEDDANDSAFAVSHNIETKKALLEEFTGVRCKYCPKGSEIAAEILSENPGKAIVVAVHGGDYSTPYAGDPDLSNPWAIDLISFSGLSGYPQGMIQRRDHNNSGKLAMNRGSWKEMANKVMYEIAPVNIAIKSTLNNVENTVNIEVELYYTAMGGGSNLLNVAICENNIVTTQAGDPTPATPYTQKHVLRDYLTGQWGDTVSNTEQGTFHTFEYSYHLKSEEVASDCDVVVFVTQSDKKEVLNAEICSMVNGVVN